MLTPRIKTALVVLAASAGLGACSSYGSYGGVGVGVGYGSQYGYGYDGGYGYGYGSPYYGYGRYPYFGWYDGFYYPGSGYWVYDPYGHRHPINTRQSHYWRNMLEKFREERGDKAEVKQSFAGFRERARSGATIPGVNLDAQPSAPSAGSPGQVNARRDARVERQREMRAAREQARTERPAARSESGGSMRERVIERRRRGGGG